MARARTTWTREQAREAAIAREARKRQARAERAARAAQRPQPTRSNGFSAAQDTAASFPSQIAAHVRARVWDLLSHLDRLCLQERPDFSQVDRLASALERLAELERVLDGRPLPGSRRPPPSDATRPTTVPAPEPTPQAPAGSTARELADLDDLEYSPPP